MAGLTPETLDALRKTLIRCGVVKDQGELESKFTDLRISAHKAYVPERDSQIERANGVIDKFLERYQDGENVLVLFLEVAAGEIHEGDDCRRALEQLAADVAEQVKEGWEPGRSGGSGVGGSSYLKNRSAWDSQDAVREAQAHFQELPLDHVPEVSPPAGWTMRQRLEENVPFAGREPALKTMARVFKEREGIRGRWVALTGMGGVGKTRLALEFASRYGRYFDGGVFWLDFSEREDIPRQVSKCGREMFSKEPAFKRLELEQQLEVVREAWHKEVPRLLIFDNCEDPALLDRWAPAYGGCCVLLTSRRDDWSPPGRLRADKVVRLDVLSEEESVSVLRAYGGGLMTDEQAAELAAEVGYLPLALHLVGSYFKRYGHDEPAPFDRAMAELQKSAISAEERSLIWTEGRADEMAAKHAADIRRIFRLSWARLDRSREAGELAHKLMARAAYFVPGHVIPRALLLASAETAESSLVTEALRELRNLGLTQSERGDVRVIHQMVARVARGEEMDPEAERDVERALLREARRLNGGGRIGELVSWQDHLRHVAENAAHATIPSPLAAPLLNELGLHLRRLGATDEARSRLEKALALLEAEARADAALMAAILVNLGSVRQDLGEVDEARDAYEQALSLGAKAPATVAAAAHNNLGTLARRTGNVDEAKEQYEATVAMLKEHGYGNDSRSARAYANLGTLLFEEEDPGGARGAYGYAREVFSSRLGEDHPDTALVLANLGMVEFRLRGWSAAQAFFEEALKRDKETFGEDHPRLALWLTRLGRVFEKREKWEDACQRYDRALAVDKRCYDPNHPRIARDYENVGRVRLALGQAEEAYRSFEKARQIDEEIFGRESAQYALSLSNLGSALYVQREPKAARDKYREALKLLEELGDERYVGILKKNLETLKPAITLVRRWG